MQLETNRLIIREYVREDWEFVHQYASNPIVTKHMIWGPNTAEETQGFIMRALSMQEQRDRRDYELAVVLKETGRLIGGCGIHLEETNGELGYCFHPNYWQQGYATEAASSMLAFGFHNLGLHRIYAVCRPCNFRSAKVMKRIGMKQEGHLREHMYYKGKYYDSFLFSILSHEYNARRE